MAAQRTSRAHALSFLTSAHDPDADVGDADVHIGEGALRLRVGPAHSLQEFCDLSGLDFVNRAVSEAATRGGRPESDFLPMLASVLLAQGVLST